MRLLLGKDWHAWEARLFMGSEVALEQLVVEAVAAADTMTVRIGGNSAFMVRIPMARR